MASSSSFPVRPQRLQAIVPADDLRAESRRLRSELSLTRLDLCLTMARFGDDANASENLRGAAQRAAAQGCRIIEKLLSTVPEEQKESLRQKMDWLDARRESSPPRNGQGKPNGASAVPPTNGHATNVQVPGGERLTLRETEVLKRIADGNSTKQVAAMLGITFKTAACHRYRVMDKLGIHDTATLVRYAIRQGLVRP